MRLLPTPNRSTTRRVLLAALLPVDAATVAAAVGVAARADAADAPPAVNPQDRDADAALATRLEGLAELSFPATVPTGRERPFVFAQQAAALHAAGVLDPAEPRYARNEAEALDGSGDVAGEVAALYRATQVKPDDEFAWNHRLDLIVDRMQSAERQVAYLKQVEASAGVPADVRAHAGVRQAQILVDQGRESQARDLLKVVLNDNPLSGEATRLRYRLSAARATPYERAQLLMDVLRSNPLQPPYARDLARLAAGQGLVQESLPFFALSVNTSFSQRRPDVAAALDWAAELFIAGQKPDAFKLVSTILQITPDYASAWYLDLLIVRSGGGGFPQAVQDKELSRATNVLSNRVAVAVNAAADLAGRPAAGPRATTRPVESEGAFPLPDVTAAAAQIKRATDPAQAQTPASTGHPAADPQAVRAEFVQAVADLARLQVYFARKPDAAAPLVDALRQLLPADDPLLAQVTGLQALAAGDLKAAGTALAAVAATDPLAGMGMVLVQLKTPGGKPQDAELAARKLMQDHPDGVVGAFLVEALSSPTVRLIPPPGSAQVQQLLSSFPRDLFNLTGEPSRVYAVHAEPVDVGRSYGQPLVVRVTISNMGGADLTVGEDGVVRPGLLFEMTPQLGQRQPAVYPAFDTVSGPVVIPRNGRLQQDVRVDQSALLGVLTQTVNLQFQVDGQATTNPDTGLGGYAVRLFKPFARTSVVADLPRAVNDLNAGSPRDRLTAIGTVQAYVQTMRSVRNLEPSVARSLVGLTTLVQRSRNDATPAVVAWATQADFVLAAPAARGDLLRQMAADGDWRTRQLALLLLPAVNDPALWKDVVGRLAADPQQSVKDYALATRSLLDLGLPPAGGAPPAATTRPAPPAAPTPDAPAGSPLPVPLP